jgi:phage tail sheath gpL-like
MTEELIRLVEDIFTHSKSGLLMATVRVKQAPTPALPTGEEMLDFILLFNQGQLAEVRVKTLSGAEALAKMTGITALVGSRWTQTNAASVSMSNTALSTGQLLIQLGATQLKAAAPSASAKPSFATDPAAALVAHTRGVFVRVLGKNSGATLDAIIKHHNPTTDPEGFFAACRSELEPMVGKQGASEMLKA